MTTTELDAAMQAAERLRRINVDSRDHVYFWLGDPITGIEHDREALADFALSILPKRKRPVPVEPKYGNIECFGVCHDGVVRRLFGNMRYGNPMEPAWTYEKGDRVIFLEGPGYANEADARLALHWQRLDELMPASS